MSHSSYLSSKKTYLSQDHPYLYGYQWACSFFLAHKSLGHLLYVVYLLCIFHFPLRALTSQHWHPKPLKASVNLQDGVDATTKILTLP